jgi:hypothetical protein
VEKIGSAISVTLVLQLATGKPMKLDASTFIERDAWVDALQVSTQLFTINHKVCLQHAVGVPLDLQCARLNMLQLSGSTAFSA